MCSTVFRAGVHRRVMVLRNIILNEGACKMPHGALHYCILPAYITILLWGCLPCISFFLQSHNDLVRLAITLCFCKPGKWIQEGVAQDHTAYPNSNLNRLCGSSLCALTIPAALPSYICTHAGFIPLRTATPSGLCCFLCSHHFQHPPHTHPYTLI